MGSSSTYYDYSFPATSPLIGGQVSSLPNYNRPDPFRGVWQHSDFTSPKYILKEVNNRSQFTPVGAGYPGLGQQPYGKNPSASSVLSSTQTYLNGPIPQFSMPVSVVNGPYVQPVPDLSNYSNALQFQSASGFFQNGIQTEGYRPFPGPLPGFPLGINPQASDIGGLVNGFQYGVYPQQVPPSPRQPFYQGYGYPSPTQTSCASSALSVCDFYGDTYPPAPPVTHPHVKRPATSTNASTSTPSVAAAPETVTVIQDGSGATSQNYQSGNSQNIRFVGDQGANVFNLGGQNNRFEVNNIGSDDTVTLQGSRADWRRSEDTNAGDGIITLENASTGSVVTLKTDKRRNDDFLNGRLRFSS